ncbi:MAG: YgfZ/GcvT domain-containing protein [Kangiellaceae bacterium]
MDKPNLNQLTKLTRYSCIDLVGDGVKQFLNGQLTIDTKSINSEVARLAALCNHKGRIVALFHVLLIENGVRFILPTSTTDAATTHIKKYAVFFKVNVLVNTCKLYAGLSNANENSNYIRIENTDLLLCFEGNRFDANPNEDTDDSFWYSHLIDKKISWLDQETVEHFLPHYLDLPKLGAIDFKKGCFTGQEVIARMQYKGKLKQHLHPLKSQKLASLEAKDKLYQGDKSVGEVVCLLSDAKTGTKLLALVKDSANLSQQFQTSPENSPILELIS